MEFHRLEIRSKVTNIAEIERKVLEEVSRQLRSSADEQSDLGTFVVSSLDGDSEAGCGEPFLNFDLKSVEV